MRHVCNIFCWIKNKSSFTYFISIPSSDDIATAQGGGGGGGGANADAIAVVDASSMLQANQWCRIPTGWGEDGLGSWTNGFKVCDTSGYYRCGSSCTWTVPGGTTCVRFQIWGSGGGTSESRCCMHTMPGDTGAYASVIMPVTSGSSYTMCGGCAYCCYAGSDGWQMGSELMFEFLFLEV